MSQSLSTIDSQVGLDGTIIGMDGAVGKAIVKSDMPPLQKVGLIVGASITVGLRHSFLSGVSIDTIRAENKTTYFKVPVLIHI